MHRKRHPRRRNRVPWFFALGMLAISCAPAVPLTPSHPPGAPPPYLIGAGDTLEVLVWREADLSGPVQVRHDGKITVALIGDITAAGRTSETLGHEIQTKLERVVENPNVVVRVTATGSRRFFVVGNVRTPGVFDLGANQTFLQALAIAGGFTEFADRNEVRIIRKDSPDQPLLLDYKAMIRGKALDPPLEPNDTIVVP